MTLGPRTSLLKSTKQLLQSSRDLSKSRVMPRTSAPSLQFSVASSPPLRGRSRLQGSLASHWLGTSRHHLSAPAQIALRDRLPPRPSRENMRLGGGCHVMMSKRGRAGRARPAGARTARGRASQIRLSRLGAARQTGRAAAAARRASRRGHFRRQGAAPPPSCHSSRKGAGEWGLGPEGARQAGPTWRRTRCSAPGPRAAPGALEA